MKKVLFLVSWLYAIIIQSLIFWGFWWCASHFVDALQGPIPFLGAVFITLMVHTLKIKINIK